jgi:hypothetical protein
MGGARPRFVKAVSQYIPATAIIYAARSLGPGSTPMIGFDAEAVHREFGRAEDEVKMLPKRD